METLRDLVNKRNDLIDTADAVKVQMEINHELINTIISGHLAEARKLKKYGSVTFAVQDVIVKHNSPKKVEYDDEKMAKIWEKIEKSGDNPEIYIDKKTKYKILEKDFESFADPIKAVFDGVRTMKAGTVKIEFKILEV